MWCGGGCAKGLCLVCRGVVCMLTFDGCGGGCGVYRVGVLFYIHCFSSWVGMVWLRISFPDVIVVGELVGEVCMLGVRLFREDVSEMYYG